MNPELLKLTNPKTTRLDGAGGGVPEITTDDINAACSGADMLGLDMLLARVCGDRQRENDAFYRLYNAVVGLAVERKWKIREKGREKIRSLTQLAIFELTHPPRCPSCRGTKYNRAMRQCKACKGTGFYKIKDAQRARALGVEPSTWGRVWQYRYALVLGLISEHESEALRNIGKKLKRRLT